MTGLLLGFGMALAGAQSWPTRPVRFLVPFPPGGGNDTIARAVAIRLQESLGQPVVIDNRAGAGGLVGAEAAARAAPDGYTLFLAGVATHGILPALQRRLPYDPVRDFAPVSLLAQAPLLLVVHPSLPVRDVRELVALARKRPGALDYASNGAGGSAHMAAELFLALTATRMVHVPYKGLAPAMTDLLSGQVPVMFSSAVAMLPFVESRKLRAIGITSAQRSPVLPDLPTVAEQGVPGYQTGSWYGVVTPAGVPDPVLARLAGELGRVMRMQEIRERLRADMAEPVGSSPAQFGAHIREELARWAKVVRQNRLADVAP